ncbi:MAG: hypothetical protein AAGA83_14345 [Cyanobacteria bacterium P01_F01_bin.116]
MSDLWQEALDSLPPPVQKVTLKEKVKEHLDDINERLKQKQTYAEIHCGLKRKGINIAISTLRKYVQQFNRAAKQTSSTQKLPLPRQFR